MLLGMVLCVCAQNDAALQPGIGPRMNARERLQRLTLVTPAYRKEALRLLIEEVNRVAKELQLPEKLPITESNLTASYLSPPNMAGRVPGFGNLSTSNYVYFVTVGNKFSFLERTHLAEEQEQLEKQFLWPISRMDTNAAYQVATQLLVAASIDVKALNRDCSAHILPLIPDGEGGNRFVPIYTVYWMKRDQVGSIAEVEFVEPTKTILQMRVMKSEYILRKPLVITNLDFLLSQTNTPAGK